MNHLIDYILHLADDALILGHRNSEWCGHGPILEQDIAITNISLDLIGQARNFYQYAAVLINQTSESDQPSTEDTLAYLRNVHEFKNCLLTEQGNSDWGQTIMRQFLFSSYQFLLYEKMQSSNDKQLSDIASKALKEVTYHVRWSSEWVIRLGDGTNESHRRMLNAINNLWPYTKEMFDPTDYEVRLAEQGTAVNLVSIKPEWIAKVKTVFNEATLQVPDTPIGKLKSGGKTGKHTENLKHILSEMQELQRTYPGCEW